MMARLQEGDSEEDQETDGLIPLISNIHLWTSKPVQ